MRGRTIPNIQSPTGQHGFDYDIIKEFHRENINIINDQINLLTSESERLNEENDKLADEITSLNQEITQLSSLLNSLSYDNEDPFNNNQQRSAIEARLQLASQQITLKKNQITKNNTRISEINRLITEANTAVTEADILITNIIRDIKNADSSSAKRLKRLIENIQAYNQNIKNIGNKLSEYGAKYDGDTKVGKVTIDGKEYDIKDKLKGFDKRLVDKILFEQFEKYFSSNFSGALKLNGSDVLNPIITFEMFWEIFQNYVYNNQGFSDMDGDFRIADFLVWLAALALAGFDIWQIYNMTNDTENPEEELKKKKEQAGLGDILEDAKEGRDTKGRTDQWDKDGDYEDALEDFEKLNPKVTTENSDKKVGILSDGRIAIVRKNSTEGSPTLEIQSRDGSGAINKRIKIRYK